MRIHTSLITAGLLAVNLGLFGGGCAPADTNAEAPESSLADDAAVPSGLDPDDAEGSVPKASTPTPVLALRLRVHLMRDITMSVQGVSMQTFVSENDVRSIILPEVNRIWSPAGVSWSIESVINESVIKNSDYEAGLDIIESASRDDSGHSDDARLLPLYKMMNPQYRATSASNRTNLLHVYIFPFIGNTSQGNSMQGQFQANTVVGAWTNKFNGGRAPQRTSLTESWSSFQRGSLSRTIAHEVGHVLGLNHGECPTKCLMGAVSGGTNGYTLTSTQISVARATARSRQSSSDQCPNDPNKTAPGTCGCGIREPVNVAGYRDAQNFLCSDWLGYDCTRAAEQYGYTAAQETSIVKNCALSCNICP